MNIIGLFQVKSSSLINVFFTYKLVALLFNFRTSCKLQPKYDVAFVGDSSIIGYFCGRQLLSRQHQPCSPKVQTNIQNYTCQLFLRYKREIFILGVLGFLKTTRSFPKIPEEVRSLPKKSEVFRRRPKSSEDVRSLSKAKLSRKRLSTKSEIARKVLLFMHLHMVFVPFMGLS